MMEVEGLRAWRYAVVCVLGVLSLSSAREYLLQNVAIKPLGIF